MVVLHGLGDSMDGYRWLPGELGLPAMNYLLVNAPDDYFGGYSWYDFAGDADAGVRRSRAMLFDLLDGLWKQGGNPARTLVFGFSQGSLMAVEIGVRYGRVLGGLIGISGYVHQPAELLAEMSPVAKRQRFLLTHGTLDPLIPMAMVRAQVFELKRAGLDVDWREFAKVHTIAGEEELEVIRDFAGRVA